jgi:phosphoserine phosphatase RsbU/P
MKPVRPIKARILSKVMLLGEQIINTRHLDEQCVLIKKTVEEIFGVEVDLWLDIRLFNLPGKDFSNQLLRHTPEDIKQLIFTKNSSILYDKDKRQIAVSLRSHDLILGVLLLQSQGKYLTDTDIEILRFLASHVALALTASHQSAVEQWRVEQLTLVRRVSAQIANVQELKVLTRRVTKLILETFNFYYVAIYTLIPGLKHLEFWSSSGPGEVSTFRNSQRIIKVELGQGLIGKAAITGEEIITDDVYMEPQYRAVFPLLETKSEVVLPMKIGKRLLGILDIQSDKIGAFHPNDLLVLRALADNIAIAVNGSQLYTKLEARANQLSIVSAVSKDITSILDLGELLNKVVTLIHERLKFLHVYVYTVHTNRRQIIYEAGSGARINSMAGYSISMDSPIGMIPWVTRSGQSLLANNVAKEPKYYPSPFPPENTRSELAIPLLFDKKPIGVLDLQSDKLNAFDEEDLVILEALADSIAAAIHNADLYKTERWRRQVADSLREVAGLISADMGIDEVLDRVLHELQLNLPCDIAAAWLMDGDDFYLAHIHGSDMVETEEARRDWPEVNQQLHEILISEQPVIRKPADPFEPTGIAHGFSADYSSISIAMRVRDRQLGILTLSHHTTGRYGHEAQAVISTFANYAAVALENARLYDATQEQAYASAALLQVAQTVANSNNLSDTISSIIRVTPILVGIKACAIYIWEKDHFQTWAGYGFPDDVEELICQREFRIGDFPLLDLTFEQQQMKVGVLAMELPEDWLDPELAKDEKELNYAIQTSDNLLIGIPLIIRNDIYGILLIHESAEDRRFRQKRLEILTGIAQQVAMSIQNDHLQREMVARERLEHEIQLARQIQQAFLPEKLPDLIDWELAAKWKPAREVGGDFYDVFELPGRKIGLLIADVSDKGIPAALFMALTRTVIRASVHDSDSPASVMKRVNEIIFRDNRESMFVTAIYGVLSLDSGAFVYTNAGHNPPIWISDLSNEPKYLNRTGPALGVIEDADILERAIKLKKGDSLLLYTDGLTEAFSPEGLNFGLENVVKAINSINFSSNQELLNYLESTLDAFTGVTPLADDLTLLAIHRKARV